MNTAYPSRKQNSVPAGAAKKVEAFDGDRNTMLKAPFLRRITLDPAKIDRAAFPFDTLPFLADDFVFDFEAAVTIFVGENGSGKSTLIEAIAQAAGFSPQGGSLAIIATHSPILMNLPGAALRSLDGGVIRPVRPEDTDHVRLTRRFLDNPTVYLVDLFRDLG